MKIGIVILATNAYFSLGIRFMKRFMHFYKGDSHITFYFFSDTDPKGYMPDSIDYQYTHVTNTSWVDGTNLKFVSVISLEKCDADYLFYFDADTNVSKDFTENWFLGELVGGQHYADQGWMKDKKNYDRNPKSKAYVPIDTEFPQMYYYGAFFGGTKNRMLSFCKKMRYNQLADKIINYEPGVNDESYINQYFHYNPPTKVVLNTDFAFEISDKGGISNTRDTSKDTEFIKRQLLNLKDQLINIRNNEVECQ